MFFSSTLHSEYNQFIIATSLSAINLPYHAPHNQSICIRKIIVSQQKCRSAFLSAFHNTGEISNNFSICEQLHIQKRNIYFKIVIYQ